MHEFSLDYPCFLLFFPFPGCLVLDLAFKEVKKADDLLSQEEVVRVIEGSQLKAAN